jgi:uncharacterized protein YcbK (DUF882 family)
VAAGETRTISLVHQHTKEHLTVTYKVNGRYVPSAMKKLNRFFRDWRRNETITIDPRTIDLVWELHADLGSKRPIHIVSGYRSPKTNAFLKRIGRKVAKKSQHMKGKAIDFFFPDVPTAKIRNVALAHRVGGVGYYRSAGGPTGFIHADSGNVRQWGPGMRGSQVASYIRDGKKVIGNRHGKKLWSSSQVASADTGEEKKSGGLIGLLTGSRKKQAETAETPAPLEAAYSDSGEAIAGLAADAAATQTAADYRNQLKLQAPTPIAEPYGLDVEDEEDSDEIANGELAALSDSLSVAPKAEGPEPAAEKFASANTRNVPRPRLKPAVVMQMAAARQADEQFRIFPANAPPESQTARRKPSQVADPLGSLIETQTANIEPSVDGSKTSMPAGIANLDGKSDLNEGLRSNVKEEEVIIRPVVAALSAAETSLWSLLSPDVEDDLRRDGLPADFNDMKQDIMPVAVELGPDGTGPATSLDVQSEASGKGDAEEINRDGKGNLLATGVKLTYQTAIEDDTTVVK